MIPIEMGVDLGGGEVSVSQHLLYAAQVCASLEKVRRKRVPQLVGRDRPADSRFQRVTLEQLPKALPAQRPCSPADKQRGARPFSDQGRTGALEVLPDDFGRALAHRHQALFSALSGGEQIAGLKIYVVDRQSGDLANAQARGV